MEAQVITFPQQPVSRLAKFVDHATVLVVNIPVAVTVGVIAAIEYVQSVMDREELQPHTTHHIHPSQFGTKLRIVNAKV